MNARDVFQSGVVEGRDLSGAELLRPLLNAPVGRSQQDSPAGVVTGVLVGLADGGRIPLVTYPGQPGTAALPARTVVDVHGQHIGRQLVLMLEAGDPAKPIIMGLLREEDGWPLETPAGVVEVDVDGTRLIVGAKEQVVIRCGKASITLTKAGKVLIHGTYVITHASGVNRIKGGAVQIN